MKLKVIVLLLFSLLWLNNLFAQSKTKLVPVLVPAKTVIVNSINHRYLFAGTTRLAYPIQLPTYTRGWYYRLVVEPRDAQASRTQDLLSSLIPVLSSNPYSLATGAALKFLAPLPRTESCDFFIFNKEADKTSFETFSDVFNTWHQDLNIQSGYGYFDFRKPENFWLGIRNNNQMQGLKVSLEVVALVGWSEANIKQLQSQIKVQPFELKNGVWLDDSQSLLFIGEETLLQLIKKYTPDEVLTLSEIERRDMINLTIEAIGNTEFSKVPESETK